MTTFREDGAETLEWAARYLERQCLKTHLRPADIAEMALWLCADESALCTGQTFTVDGGVA